ncbi:hypothetical protein NGM37_59445 [Streptomyces sp. TRM76130]|nr:hypothetical protein [Streptomyces sp. TRM76130]
MSRVLRMKALVVSGGCGARLRPITRTSAGQWDPGADEPVLRRGPEGVADTGSTEVGTLAGETAGRSGRRTATGRASVSDVTHRADRAALGTVEPPWAARSPRTANHRPGAHRGGARVVRSRIVIAAVIGAGGVVENARVGPFASISPGCRIADTARPSTPSRCATRR